MSCLHPSYLLQTQWVTQIIHRNVAVIYGALRLC